jgi:hypothetical protein
VPARGIPRPVGTAETPRSAEFAEMSDEEHGVFEYERLDSL